ncbi:hypothetical protein EKE94_05510 [Mesobaculum littorinae]|uniref:Uncharacterized protein n=1 Tax=Mesobaculum littorinae TaxID=2486419 RepID=A0A438AI21_9RHOB|nr:hypothetical protein [Mesobaculum littorinae]RVV98381.1 hypothetical protein EKE94_05510 [Mesobaculum littorinae]
MSNRKEPRRPIDDCSLVTFRGTVVSVADRVTHQLRSGQHSSSPVRSVPEVWIVDSEGHELRFCDETLGECRTGHEILIVGDGKSDRVLAMHNLSTAGTWFSTKVSDLPVNRSHVFTIICLCVALTFMTWFVTLMLFGEPSYRDSFWEDLGRMLCYLSAVAVGWWGPEKARTRFNKRNAARRARIEAAVEDAIQ